MELCEQKHTYKLYIFLTITKAKLDLSKNLSLIINVLTFFSHGVIHCDYFLFISSMEISQQVTLRLLEIPLCLNAT